MNINYHGIYAPYIDQLVSLKRQLGLKYTNEAYMLSLFDKFTIQSGESCLGITRELAMQWAVPRANESVSFLRKRIMAMNQLASFLTKQGIGSYVLMVPKAQHDFVPYIFTHDQMGAIFNGCDLLRLKSGQKSIIICLPALVRFLYATGLRIGEALALQDGAINLIENHVTVQDSKNGQQRIIPISGTLSEVLRDYVRHRDKVPVLRSGYFFSSLSGKPCQVGDVQRWFKRVLTLSNINRTSTGPRLHDLRHTFAVHSLSQMAESGMDLHCSLPYLPRYLGHMSIQSTNGYVRLTAELFPSLLKEVEMVCFNIFPKLPAHETN